MAAAQDGAGRWRWVGIALAAVAVLALAGMGFSAYLFSRWSDLRTVGAEEAELTFAAAVARAGGGPAYMEISPAGRVSARRELERPEPTDLTALHVLAWDPAQSKLLRIGFPFWFVRVKMTDAVNLGTITSVLTGDWTSLDLKVSVEELERLGPGLVLDHTLASGARVLLWTETGPEP